jgi:hypothetical protein
MGQEENCWLEKDGVEAQGWAVSSDDAVEETSMLSVSRPTILCVASAACALLGLSGCSVGRVIPSAGSQTVALHMQGKLHGGQQPVVGATIQLYDISLSGGFGAVPMIGSTVTSDANGGFTITGEYSCTTGGATGPDQVYLVATGGDAGSGANADLVMMTALGNCDSLTASTFIWVNEVTTAATIFAYVDDFDQTQTGGANITNVFDGNEYTNFLTLVDPATGVALTNNGAGVQLQLNALANTISVCVNSATDVQTGHSAACDTLIAMANGGSNTPASSDSSQAMYLMAAYPGYDPTDEFNYGSANPPFQPTLTAAPQSGWDLGIDYLGCARPSQPTARFKSRLVHPRC